MSDNSFNSSIQSLPNNCLESRTTTFIFTSLLIINVLLLLPLLVFVLYLGVQQWRQHCSGSATSVMSHSNFFTYNMAALDLISILGSCFYCFGAYVDGQMLQWLGSSTFYLTIPGQSLFHVLTCVERYLAVVHPITYLGLKQADGVRIRNISTGCVWLLCLALTGLAMLLSSTFNLITNSCIMIFSLILVSFCSFSVLRVLNHAGPGEVSRDREGVHQSKQRAFYTIVAIMVAQSFGLLGILVCSAMFASSVLTHTKCAVGSSAMLLTVPCSLVLPLLYLQRAGKLGGQKKTWSKDQI